MWKGTLLFCIVVKICLCQIREIAEQEQSLLNILGVFEPSAVVEMGAFKESMRNAVGEGNQRLDPRLYKPDMVDSYSVLREICTNTPLRTIAVLGPHNLLSDKGVLNYCSKLKIPYLQATWQPYDPESEGEDLADVGTENKNNEEEVEVQEDRKEDEENDNADDEDLKNGPFKNIAINFYPDSNEIANAYAQVLNYYKWENFVVLYEDDYGLLRVQKIISNHSTNFPVVFRQLDTENVNYEIFKEISKMQESRIILDCHVDNTLTYLTIAANLKMVNSYQHYILTSMDTYKVAEELTKYSSDFTWLSLTEYEKLKSSQGTDLTSRVGSWTTDGFSLPVVNFTTDALLMDDVARHVLKAVEKSGMPRTSQGNLCSGKPWKYGSKLQEAMLSDDAQQAQHKPIRAATLRSFLIQRGASGFTTQRDPTKTGEYFVELRVYNSREAERLPAEERWKNTLTTLKVATDTNTPLWTAVSKLVQAGKQDFVKIQPIMYPAPQ